MVSLSNHYCNITVIITYHLLGILGSTVHYRAFVDWEQHARREDPFVFILQVQAGVRWRETGRTYFFKLSVQLES
jgi:hypothetical protein